MATRKKKEPTAKFTELPTRRHVDLALDDPRMSAPDYAGWAAAAGVLGAIVKVSVRLTPASPFDPEAAAQALGLHGAYHLLPLVPTLPKSLPRPGSPRAARLPP